MARQLVVILGAGASADCVTPGSTGSSSYKPPLVKELFDQTYQHILNRYALTLDVAADLRPRLAEPGPETEALKLEDYLRVELRDSTSPQRRARYWSVPLYLQELLLECAQQYTTLPANLPSALGSGQPPWHSQGIWTSAHTEDRE